MSFVDVNHLNSTRDLSYTAREESFLVPAKAGAHGRQAQLFHQVSMSVVDEKSPVQNNGFIIYSQRRIFLCPSRGGAHARQVHR
jgi:hypothetical protein